jgi:hypothetical protein
VSACDSRGLCWCISSEAGMSSGQVVVTLSLVASRMSVVSRPKDVVFDE